MAQDTRTVASLMAVTVGFSLIGNEIDTLQGKSKANFGVLGNSPTIILGGVVATAILATIAEAGGEGGAHLAKGLALVAMVSATLVYGGPVWASLGNLVKAKGTTTTPTTTATTPAVTSTVAKVGAATFVPPSPVAPATSLKG